MDDNFWRQVDRARRMTGAERFREGLALVDRSFRLMDDGIRHQFPGASPESCPTDPSLFTCEVGHISGYGRVTQVFTFESFRRVGECNEVIGTALWTLIDDRSSTLTTREVVVDCRPGASASAPGNRFHSFGNPFAVAGFPIVAQIRQHDAA